MNAALSFVVMKFVLFVALSLLHYHLIFYFLLDQTEDRLDTLRRLECIQTKQAEEARHLLEGKRSIVIKGNPGEGKTTTALHLIDNEMYRNKRVVLETPKQWEHVDTDWINIIVLEDVFGKFDLDDSRLQEWMRYLSTIQEHVDAGKLRVIVTSRVDIMLKVNSKLGSLKLFSDELTLTLSSENLNNLDKIGILNRELRRHGRNMDEDEKEKCIYNFNGLIGFPQCCLLFAGDNKLFETGPEFFGAPKKFFVENITQLEATRFLSLAFLFCNGKTCEEHLSSKTMPEASKNLLKELASNLRISKKEASITLLRSVYDDYCKLYVVKYMSYNLESVVDKPYIRFTHATVCEAVGQVLGDRCLEMLIRYGDSEYLYQRTYTAETKDITSQNLFIPVSLYGLLAERMVRDVVKRHLIGSVVKYSALKQQNFLMQLKCELHRATVINDFFVAVPQFMAVSEDHLSEGNCITIMQHVLQSDDEVVKLVYSQLLEFLACAHNNNNSSDCWQCEEKQKLLELALYYRHFEIADKLITMNACYTHISLCNAARHGDRGRIATILEILKKSQVFNPECKEAKYALCRAYISGNQISIELLLNEGIVLDSCHVLDAVKHGDINVLLKVVEHLKFHKKWNPHLERYDEYGPHRMYLGNTNVTIPCIAALYSTYCNEKFDMADYLLKCEAKLSMFMLVDVSDSSSKQAVARVIQNLKDTGIWNPCGEIASEALEEVYIEEKNDVYDLLVQEGVSLKMKNFYSIIVRCQMSLESVTNSIQLLKDFANWDPKCDYASKALEEAYRHHKFDLIHLLVQEGVSLKMNNLPSVLHLVPLEYVKKLIQNLKDTVSWNPKCDYASDALAMTYITKKYDVYDLLVQEGVSLTMKNLPAILQHVSLESTKKAIQHLKDTGNWDPNCDDVSEELASAYSIQKSDMYNLLIQEGVSLKMKNLPRVLRRVSLESAKKVIQHLKDTDNWDPMCNDASHALANAYKAQKHDVSDLLVHEGVTLTIEDLPSVLHLVSLESVKKAINHMKDIANWDPKCDDVSKLLEISYIKQKHDVFDLLIQEGVALDMKNLPAMVRGVSLEYVKKAVQHLKDNDNWVPKCDYAFSSLTISYRQHKYDVCDLLFQEGVSLMMKNLPFVLDSVSLESVKKVIQHLKDTDNWDPKCDDASDALVKAYSQRNYDVFDLLVQEGVSLNMKNLPLLVPYVSLESAKKAIQHLKDTVKWDPKCDDASEAIRIAYIKYKYDVCDLLVEEGVSLTMTNLPQVISRSLESVNTAVKQLKGSDNWDPKCDYASKALENAYSLLKHDVCDLLVQEGVSLTMTNLPGVMMGSQLSLLPVKKAVQHLKDTNQWDSSSSYAQMSFAIAKLAHKMNLCDLLINEGVEFRDNDYSFPLFSNVYFNR